jgi:hypothetical protein
MKSFGKATLIIIGIILVMLGHLAVLAYGASVKISWDPNDPAPEGYRIFQRSEGEAYDYSAPAWEGPQTSAVINCPAFGVTHYYVVRAYEGALESIDSDEVSFTMTTVPVPAITHIGEKP